jgi:hypothetical protein
MLSCTRNPFRLARDSAPAYHQKSLLKIVERSEVEIDPRVKSLVKGYEACPAVSFAHLLTCLPAFSVRRVPSLLHNPTCHSPTTSFARHQHPVLILEPLSYFDENQNRRRYP